MTDDTLTNEAHRLHPLSIPYRVVEQGLGLILAVFFAGVPAFSALKGAVGAAAALGLVVLVVAAIVGYVVAYYRRFEYELTRDTFDIRSGVFARREREIPLRRIQNVDISQNVVQRALGLAEIKMETAGASQAEAHLRYVGYDRANHIQSEVSRLSRSGDAEETDAERFETVFAISERELGVLALVSADLRVISFLLVGLSIFAPSMASAFAPEMFLSPETIVQAVLGPVFAVVSILVLGLVVGVINASRYYDFTLRRAPEELRYQRGLVQKFSGTIPLDKVQTLTLRENLLARALGYASLYIETAGQGTSSNQQQTAQSAIPIAERERVVSLAKSIEPFGDVEFERPPKRARRRYAGRYLIVIGALTAVLFAAQQFVTASLYWYSPLALVVVVPAAAHLKWKHRGFHAGDEYVVTRNGFWRRSTKIVPYHRVQTVASTETVFQRRWGLGTVVVDTAGSRSLTSDDAKAVDVDVATVEQLRERVGEELYEAIRRRAARSRAEPVTSPPPTGAATD
ncbi:MAG: PH domain-containing protein [Haloarculaceae archaeon]